MKMVLRIPYLLPIIVLALLLGMLPIAAPADVLDRVETIEFLDGTEEYAVEEDSVYSIETNGYWDTGPILFVHISAEEGVDYAAFESAIALINSSTNSTVSEWNNLLSSFEGSVPVLSVVHDASHADIKIVLTDYEHPEGKLGKARLYAIKGVGQVVSAEV